MADAEGLNPSGLHGPYGFDPRPGHLWPGEIEFKDVHKS